MTQHRTSPLVVLGHLPRVVRRLGALLLAAALAPAVQAGADAAYADRVFAAINGYRQSQGLEPLRVSAALTALAAEHSAAMAGQHRPSHDGFAGRVERTSSSLCVENVAHNFQVPETVINGWRRVSTHHRNLLEPRVAFAGVAMNDRYVTFFACDLGE